MHGDLIKRLRAEVVLKEYPPLTLIIDGKETTCNGGRLVGLHNPDGPEAADTIERLQARVAELEAAVRELTAV